MSLGAEDGDEQPTQPHVLLYVLFASIIHVFSFLLTFIQNMQDAVSCLVQRLVCYATELLAVALSLLSDTYHLRFTLLVVVSISRAERRGRGCEEPTVVPALRFSKPPHGVRFPKHGKQSRVHARLNICGTPKTPKTPCRYLTSDTPGLLGSCARGGWPSNDGRKVRELIYTR